MQTLILTPSYLPHRIVEWRKAIAMSFTGRVEVVETYAEVVRSVSRAYSMPAVVRLTRPVSRGRVRVHFSRSHVLCRDAYRCQYCGDRFEARALTLDHVVPRSRGGTTSWTNIVAACRPCNAKKADRTPSEARMALLHEPVRPSHLSFPVTSLRVGHRIPDPWKSWVPWAVGA